MVERKAFIGNPKHQDHVSQCGKHGCIANNKKNRDFYAYPCLSYFHGWTLITGKMVESKAFLPNPKHQDQFSQCREHDCRANNKINGDYSKQTSLSHFTDKH